MTKTKGDKVLMYDALFETANMFIAKYDPCEIADGKSLQDRKFKRKDNGFCCSGCEHLTSEGCGVKSLGCRISFCTTARDNMPDEAVQILHWLYELKCKHVPSSDIRKSREQFVDGIVVTQTEDLTITKEVCCLDSCPKCKPSWTIKG